jgi:hypothetical protein
MSANAGHWRHPAIYWFRYQIKYQIKAEVEISTLPYAFYIGGADDLLKARADHRAGLTEIQVPLPTFCHRAIRD